MGKVTAQTLMSLAKLSSRLLGNLITSTGSFIYWLVILLVHMFVGLLVPIFVYINQCLSPPTLQNL